MNNYHVAIVHDTKIPAINYGGTERVIWWLGEALSDLGHKVTYIVPKGSKSNFASIVERPNNDSKISNLIPKDVDIIHSFASLHEKLDKPIITTIGGNGQPGEKFHPNTVFVSQNHAKRHNSDAYVYNGLNPKDYPDFTQKEDFCYFLAKAKWKIKNVKGAINIAKKADVPIKIMGGYRPTWGSHVKWMGMVGGKKKLDVLKRGSALIFPVLWNEPFGIAIIEAMYTGSPVFGTPYGSLPELINEEVGFLSKNSSEIAGKLKKHKSFNKETLKKYVLNNFTHINMAEKYLNYYEHVIKGNTISKNEPMALCTNSPESPLDFF